MRWGGREVGWGGHERKKGLGRDGGRTRGAAGKRQGLWRILGALSSDLLVSGEAALVA